jgi:hypothetical protein
MSENGAEGSKMLEQTSNMITALVKPAHHGQM